MLHCLYYLENLGNEIEIELDDYVIYILPSANQKLRCIIIYIIKSYFFSLGAT